MIRRPPRSTLDRSSAASDVYKRQRLDRPGALGDVEDDDPDQAEHQERDEHRRPPGGAVSYTHLRAHETVLDLVCRLLLEKKKNTR